MTTSGTDSPETTVRRVFDRWSISFDEMCSSISSLLGDSGIWFAGPEPIPVCHGADEACRLLETFRLQYDLASIEVDLLEIGSSSTAVFTERVDHLVNSTGQRFISLPVVGVMRFDSSAGVVSYWRDYWDMRQFLELPVQ